MIQQLNEAEKNSAASSEQLVQDYQALDNKIEWLNVSLRQTLELIQQLNEAEKNSAVSSGQLFQDYQALDNKIEWLNVSLRQILELND